MKKVKNPRRRAFLKKLCLVSLAVAMVLALTLFNFLVPLRTLLPAYSFPALRKGEVRIHFLDVGQGDCSIIQFPDGGLFVIDAGDGSWKNTNKLTRYIKGLAPASLTMIATHADSDHCGGFSTLIKTFGAEKFYLPAIGSDSATYQKLLEAVETVGCETATLTRYDTLKDESGAYAVCLSPYSTGETNENEASTVLYFEYDGISAVFCGDISSARERKLVREYMLDETLFDSGDCKVRLRGTNILKVPHHGSAYSSCEEWADLLHAEVAVFSSGRGNRNSHPSGEALSHLSQSELYRTDELGDIVVSIYCGTYTVYTDFRRTAI